MTTPLTNPIDCKNLVELLQYRSSQQASKQAYIFLSGTQQEQPLTYGELDRQAQAIAAKLQAISAPGQTILLVYPSGLDFIAAFFGCLYGGMIAVPTPPPAHLGLQASGSRFQALLNDAQASIILTIESLQPTLVAWLATAGLSKIQCLATDLLHPVDSYRWVPPRLEPSSLALLQYTSGSTSQPKGVMLTQSNLLHNQAIIQQAFGNTEQSIGVGWLPFYHDMGLGNMLVSVYTGFPIILMSPHTFLRRPYRWLQAISHYRATTSGGPNFAFDLCWRKISPEQRATLDLRSWELAFIGAEPIRPKTLETFAHTFAECGFRQESFYPCYGLAEATLFVTGKTKGMGFKTVSPQASPQTTAQITLNPIPAIPSSQPVVSCGYPWYGQTVIIVDPDRNVPCFEGQVGEVWLAGESISQGYWQQEIATKQTFRAYLTSNGAGPYLRTGDLGFLEAGELYITGRLKDLMIIRGCNYYPQDFEITVEQSHPAVRPNGVAAFAVEQDDEEQLVIVAEIDKRQPQDYQLIIDAIRQSVAAQFQLQCWAIVLLRSGSLPKTSSGKLQRYACRQMFLAESWRVLAQEQAPAASMLETERTLENQPEKTANTSGFTISTVKPNPRVPPSPDPQHRHAEELIGWLREYARDHLNSRQIDERRSIPPQVVLDFGRQKLFGMHIPPEYNGLGLPYQDSMRVMTQLAAIDLTLATFVGSTISLGISPIQTFADHRIQEELLPQLATGQKLACFAMTEPGAGSNPRAISTQAVPDGLGGWRIRGKKIWIGNAAWAGTLNLFTQVLDGEGRACGITGFVLPRRSSGVRIVGETLTMGLRGMTQNTLELHDVQVQPQQILGRLGHGLEVAQDAFQFARLGIGAIAVGGMKRCLQLMHRYASRRSISTGLLLHNPVSLLKISEFAAATTAMEILVNQTAIWLDRGMNLPEEVLILCKVAGSELLWQTADGLVQLLGGRGYDENNLVPQILRDARIFRIFEGPTETLTLYVGANVFNHQGRLVEFLTTPLQNPTLADWLVGIMEQIKARCLKPPAALVDKQMALQWGYSLVGEISLQTLMLAIAQFATVAHPSSHQLQVQEWLRRRLDQTVADALKGQSAETALLNPKQLTELVNSWQTAIGDVEQCLHLQENTFDELLQIQPPWPLDAALSFEQEVGGRENASVQDETLSHKITQWLMESRKIPKNQVDFHQPFSHYGVDSLASAELIAQLEAFTQTEIDSGLLWQAPSIAAFVQSLKAQKVKVAELPNPDVSPEEFRLDQSKRLQESPNDSPNPIPLAHYSFTHLPEYQGLQERLQTLVGVAKFNPYFKVQDTVARHTSWCQGQEFINFATYNYLDLASHPTVTQAAVAAIERYGTSVSASRVAGGERPIHQELERAIAEFLGTEDSIVYVGGHTTNTSTIGHLVDSADLVLYDALSHNSIIQGCQLSGARQILFPHNDWQVTEQLLQRHRSHYRRVLIVIEGIYSADGDIPDLPKFIELKKKYQTFLMVDEAHSIGILGSQGRGIGEHFGVNPGDVDLWMGTLSKALASCGGYIAGSHELIEYLKYTSSGFVFSVGISGPNAAAALAALKVIEAEPTRVQQLQRQARFFLEGVRQRGLRSPAHPGSAVVPVLVGDSERCIRLAAQLFERGINVVPMIAPAVEPQGARLRFFLSYAHTQEQLNYTLDTLAQEMANL